MPIAGGAPLHPLHEGGVMLSPMILCDFEQHHAIDLFTEHCNIVSYKCLIIGKMLLCPLRPFIKRPISVHRTLLPRVLF